MQSFVAQSGRQRFSPIFAHEPRSVPTVSKLAVITCVFNPSGFATSLNNYRRFASAVEDAGLPLYTAELAFDDQEFSIAPDPRVLRIRSCDVLWHKERLLNQVLRTVPADYDSIAWIDADILLDNPEWVADTLQQLQSFPIVQLFDTAVYLDRSGVPSHRRTGLVHGLACDVKPLQAFRILHAGFAWAARRSFLDRHGLYDMNVCGGGDAMMACAFYGWWDDPFIHRHPHPMQKSFRRWAGAVWNDVQSRVGYIAGNARHLWHGEPVHRQYVERHGWFRRVNFDPRKDLRVGSNGTWRWTDPDCWLHQRMRQYFLNRKEDG